MKTIPYEYFYDILCDREPAENGRGCARRNEHGAVGGEVGSGWSGTEEKREN